MAKNLVDGLSNVREIMIKSNQEYVLVKLSTRHLNEIITGLKMNNAFDEVLDEELNIKNGRR